LGGADAAAGNGVAAWQGIRKGWETESSDGCVGCGGYEVAYVTLVSY
jgi:hypothetical protein